MSSLFVPGGGGGLRERRTRPDGTTRRERGGANGPDRDASHQWRCLDICLEQEVRQIALIDAPSVVGCQKWREVDARYGLGLLRNVLGLAAEGGHIDARQVEHLAHLFLGAVSEAAMVVAHAPGDADVRSRMGDSLTWMIDRLLSPK